MGRTLGGRECCGDWKLVFFESKLERDASGRSGLEGRYA